MPAIPTGMVNPQTYQTYATPTAARGMAQPGLNGLGTSGTSGSYGDSKWTATPANVAQQNNEAGNYYQRGGNGTVWMRPNGGDNTSWAYGAQAPTEGVDQRAWTSINNPNAYQYGGQQGGASMEENRYAGMGATASANAAPQMDLGAYQNDLGNGAGGVGTAADAQYNALEMARQNAMGYSPSVAYQQMGAGIAQAGRAQAQQAASARGGGANLVAAQQVAATAAGNVQANAVTQAGVQAAQEKLAAQNAYAQQASGMRSAGLQQAGLSAQLAQQQASFGMSQNQLNQQGQVAYEQMRQGVFNAQQNAQMQGEAQNANTGMTAAQMQAAKNAADAAFERQLIGGTLTAAGTVGGAMIGGPAGAAVGGMAGQAAGGAVGGAVT